MKNNISKIVLLALNEARKASYRGEIPVGAVIFNDNEIISKASNMVETSNDVTAHAEILVMKRACNLLSLTRLNDYNLYVTLEPCPMCLHAISLFRIKKLYFGAYDTSYLKRSKKKIGISTNQINGSNLETYGGIGTKESEKLLKSFFKTIRGYK